jgi:hypothetical protein
MFSMSGSSQFPMSVEAGDHSPFQAIAKDELTAILSKFPPPRYLTFSQQHFAFLKCALAQPSWDLFDQKLFLEKLADTRQTGVIFCFALDTRDDLLLACRQLAKLPNFDKHLLVIPRVTTLCQELVEQSGVRINLIDFHLDIVPIDRYCFLVPAFQCFSRCFIESDITDLYSIARSLAKFQMIHGRPNRVFTCGSMSSRVYELLEAQKAQIGLAHFNPNTVFDELFVIDRTVDLVTPLLTQFTYAGQLDDRFGIDFGDLPLPKGLDIADPAHPDEPLRTFHLCDATGEVYPAICGLPLAEVENYLRGLMNEIGDIKEKMAGSTGTSQWTIYAARAAKLLKLQHLIPVHLGLLERVLSVGWLEYKGMSYELSLLDDGDANRDLLVKFVHAGKLIDALRLLCLDSVISRGVPQKLVQDIHRRLVYRLGLRVSQDLIGLEKCGLLKTSALLSLSRGVKFETIRKELRLLVDPKQRRSDPEGNDLGPSDVGASYDNYVPLLVRIVQAGLSGGWEKGGVADRILGQMDIEHAVVGEPGQAKVTADGTVAKKVLVFVIGGVTQSECLIFNQLGKIIFDDKFEFHVGSTNITSGSKIIKDVCPNVANALARNG